MELKEVYYPQLIFKKIMIYIPHLFKLDTSKGFGFDYYYAGWLIMELPLNFISPAVCLIAN